MTCTILTSGEEINLRRLNELEPPYPAVKKRLREAVLQAFWDGCDKFYVNCEYGIPLWAAEMVIALKMYNPVSLHLVIPFEEQCTYWHEEWRDRYFEIHSKADEVILASTHYYSQCYRDAEKIMIRKSDMILVYGTAPAAVEYAVWCKKRVRYI